MARFFVAGETETRPGVYQRYRNATPTIAEAVDGICACIFVSNWGPLGVASPVSDITALNTLYGTSGTTQVAREIFNGGAIRTYCVRLGSGGTNGTLALKDTAETPNDVVTISGKYPGSKVFSISLRPAIEDPAVKTLYIYGGTTEVEKVSFNTESPEQEAKALVDAVTASNSKYITATDNGVQGASALATVNQAPISRGTDPEITNEDYSAALTILEKYGWNVIATDSIQPEIHVMVLSFLNRIYAEGQLCMGVAAEPTSVTFDTRLNDAKNLDDEKMIFFGSGCLVTGGARLEGAAAGGRIAGLVASTPSSASIVHSKIVGGTELLESLSHKDYKRAIAAGAIMLSLAANNEVWIDSGINTLNTLREEQDAGWKKIKRTKVRFELMTRVDLAVAPLAGKITPDSDGWSAVIQAAMGVCGNMELETKIAPGYSVALAPDYPPTNDSAWFLIAVDDVDTLEKIYLVYEFRFSQVQ